MGWFAPSPRRLACQFRPRMGRSSSLGNCSVNANRWNKTAQPDVLSSCSCSKIPNVSVAITPSSSVGTTSN